MENIIKVRSFTLWIFLVPFAAINICLVLVTNFHDLFRSEADILYNTIPYIDGKASISRVARVFPTYFIFKPAMLLTSFLLIKYWLYNKEIIKSFDNGNKNIKKIVFFGVGSAILLTVHTIFLGIKFDHDLYKLFRRIIMVSFILFEIIAQAYLVLTLYKIKNKILSYININFLVAKRILVSALIIVAIISIPIISAPGYKFLKHALEWNYFVGVISFYLLTFFMWKNNN